LQKTDFFAQNPGNNSGIFKKELRGMQAAANFHEIPAAI